MSEHGPIVQTNIDHWSSAEDEDVLFSIRRRALSKQLLSPMKEVNEHDLWKVSYFSSPAKIDFFF